MKEKKLLLRAKKNRLAVSSLYEVYNSHQIVATFHSNPSRSEYKYIKTVESEKVGTNVPKKKQTYDSSIIKLTPVKVELSSIASP